MTDLTPTPDISLVVALYFEEECVAEFIRRVREELDGQPVTYEIVFVDDGSQDRTVAIVTEYAAADPRLKLVQLSRNHGKEAAVTAGIAHASGDYLVMMDPDLQDPPERILDFKRKMEEGYDVVFGVRKQKADTLLNTLFSKIFWSSLNTMTGLKIPRNLAVMRMFNRAFAQQFLQYPERVRFIEGIFMLVGMRQATLEVDNFQRFAGVSKFNFRRKMLLALNAMLGFSDRPIQLTVTLGLGMCGVAAVGALYLLIRRLAFGVGLLGWTSTILVILFIGGLQTVTMGLIGMYVGRIYSEVKGRPVYNILRKVNLP